VQNSFNWKELMFRAAIGVAETILGKSKSKELRKISLADSDISEELYDQMIDRIKMRWSLH
jgi:hypothetical protein